MIDMTKLNGEQSRTYHFPKGEAITLKKVTHFGVRPGGTTHRLRTADGKLHIVPAGWLHIEIDAKDWTL